MTTQNYPTPLPTGEGQGERPEGLEGLESPLYSNFTLYVFTIPL